MLLVVGDVDGFVYGRSLHLGVGLRVDAGWLIGTDSIEVRGLVFFAQDLTAGVKEFANRCFIRYDGEDAVTPVILFAPGHPGPGLESVSAFDRACVASVIVTIPIDLLEGNLLLLYNCHNSYIFRCLALDVGEYACL